MLLKKLNVSVVAVVLSSELGLAVHASQPFGNGTQHLIEPQGGGNTQPQGVSTGLWIRNATHGNSSMTRDTMATNLDHREDARPGSTTHLVSAQPQPARPQALGLPGPPRPFEALKHQDGPPSVNAGNQEQVTIHPSIDGNNGFFLPKRSKVSINGDYINLAHRLIIKRDSRGHHQDEPHDDSRGLKSLNALEKRVLKKVIAESIEQAAEHAHSAMDNMVEAVEQHDVQPPTGTSASTVGPPVPKRGRPIGTKNKLGHKAGGRRLSKRKSSWKKSGPKKGQLTGPLKKGDTRPDHWATPGPKKGDGVGRKRDPKWKKPGPRKGWKYPEGSAKPGVPVGTKRPKGGAKSGPKPGYKRKKPNPVASGSASQAAAVSPPQAQPLLTPWEVLDSLRTPTPSPEGSPGRLVKRYLIASLARSEEEDDVAHTPLMKRLTQKIILSGIIKDKGREYAPPTFNKIVDFVNNLDDKGQPSLKKPSSSRLGQRLANIFNSQTAPKIGRPKGVKNKAGHKAGGLRIKGLKKPPSAKKADYASYWKLERPGAKRKSKKMKTAASSGQEHKQQDDAGPSGPSPQPSGSATGPKIKRALPDKADVRVPDLSQSRTSVVKRDLATLRHLSEPLKKRLLKKVILSGIIKDKGREYAPPSFKQIVDIVNGPDHLPGALDTQAAARHGQSSTSTLAQRPARKKMGRPKGSKNKLGHKAGGKLGVKLPKKAESAKRGPKVGSKYRTGRIPVLPLKYGDKRPDHWRPTRVKGDLKAKAERLKGAKSNSRQPNPQGDAGPSDALSRPNGSPIGSHTKRADANNADLLASHGRRHSMLFHVRRVKRGLLRKVIASSILEKGAEHMPHPIEDAVEAANEQNVLQQNVLPAGPSGSALGPVSAPKRGVGRPKGGKNKPGHKAGGRLGVKLQRKPGSAKRGPKVGKKHAEGRKHVFPLKKGDKRPAQWKPGGRKKGSGPGVKKKPGAKAGGITQEAVESMPSTPQPPLLTPWQVLDSLRTPTPSPPGSPARAKRSYGSSLPSIRRSLASIAASRGDKGLSKRLEKRLLKHLLASSMEQSQQHVPQVFETVQDHIDSLHGSSSSAKSPVSNAEPQVAKKKGRPKGLKNQPGHKAGRKPGTPRPPGSAKPGPKKGFKRPPGTTVSPFKTGVPRPLHWRPPGPPKGFRLGVKRKAHWKKSGPKAGSTKKMPKELESPPHSPPLLSAQEVLDSLRTPVGSPERSPGRRDDLMLSDSDTVARSANLEKRLTQKIILSGIIKDKGREYAPSSFKEIVNLISHQETVAEPSSQISQSLASGPQVQGKSASKGGRPVGSKNKPGHKAGNRAGIQKAGVPRNPAWRKPGPQVGAKYRKRPGPQVGTKHRKRPANAAKPGPKLGSKNSRPKMRKVKKHPQPSISGSPSSPEPTPDHHRGPPQSPSEAGSAMATGGIVDQNLALERRDLAPYDAVLPISVGSSELATTQRVRKLSVVNARASRHVPARSSHVFKRLTQKIILSGIIKDKGREYAPSSFREIVDFVNKHEDEAEPVGSPAQSLASSAQLQPVPKRGRPVGSKNKIGHKAGNKPGVPRNPLWRKPGPEAGRKYGKRPANAAKPGPKLGSKNRPGSKSVLPLKLGEKRPKGWKRPGPPKGYKFGVRKPRFKKTQHKAGHLQLDGVKASTSPLQSDKNALSDRDDEAEHLLPDNLQKRLLKKVVSSMVPETAQQALSSAMDKVVESTKTERSKAPKVPKRKGNYKGRTPGSKNRPGHNAGRIKGVPRPSHWRPSGPKIGSKNRAGGKPKGPKPGWNRPPPLPKWESRRPRTGDDQPSQAAAVNLLSNESPPRLTPWQVLDSLRTPTPSPEASPARSKRDQSMSDSDSKMRQTSSSVVSQSIHLSLRDDDDDDDDDNGSSKRPQLIDFFAKESGKGDSSPHKSPLADRVADFLGSKKGSLFQSFQPLASARPNVASASAPIQANEKRPLFQGAAQSVDSKELDLSIRKKGRPKGVKNPPGRKKPGVPRGYKQKPGPAYHRFKPGYVRKESWARPGPKLGSKRREGAAKSGPKKDSWKIPGYTRKPRHSRPSKKPSGQPSRSPSPGSHVSRLQQGPPGSPSAGASAIATKRMIDQRLTDGFKNDDRLRRSEDVGLNDVTDATQDHHGKTADHYLERRMLKKIAASIAEQRARETLSSAMSQVSDAVRPETADNPHVSSNPAEAAPPDAAKPKRQGNYKGRTPGARNRPGHRAGFKVGYERPNFWGKSGPKTGSKNRPYTHYKGSWRPKHLRPERPAAKRPKLTEGSAPSSAHQAGSPPPLLTPFEVLDSLRTPTGSPTHSPPRPSIASTLKRPKGRPPGVKNAEGSLKPGPKKGSKHPDGSKKTGVPVGTPRPAGAAKGGPKPGSKRRADALKPGPKKGSKNSRPKMRKDGTSRQLDQVQGSPPAHDPSRVHHERPPGSPSAGGLIAIKRMNDHALTKRGLIRKVDELVPMKPIDWESTAFNEPSLESIWHGDVHLPTTGIRRKPVLKKIVDLIEEKADYRHQGESTLKRPAQRVSAQRGPFELKSSQPVHSHPVPARPVDSKAEPAQPVAPSMVSAQPAPDHPQTVQAAERPRRGRPPGSKSGPWAKKTGPTRGHRLPGYKKPGPKVGSRRPDWAAESGPKKSYKRVKPGSSKGTPATSTQPKSPPGPSSAAASKRTGYEEASLDRKSRLEVLKSLLKVMMTDRTPDLSTDLKKRTRIPMNVRIIRRSLSPELRDDDDNDDDDDDHRRPKLIDFFAKEREKMSALEDPVVPQTDDRIHQMGSSFRPFQPSGPAEPAESGQTSASIPVQAGKRPLFEQIAQYINKHPREAEIKISKKRGRPVGVKNSAAAKKPGPKQGSKHPDGAKKTGVAVGTKRRVRLAKSGEKLLPKTAFKAGYKRPDHWAPAGPKPGHKQAPGPAYHRFQPGYVRPKTWNKPGPRPGSKRPDGAKKSGPKKGSKRPQGAKLPGPKRGSKRIRRPDKPSEAAEQPASGSSVPDNQHGQPPGSPPAGGPALVSRTPVEISKRGIVKAVQYVSSFEDLMAPSEPEKKASEVKPPGGDLLGSGSSQPASSHETPQKQPVLQEIGRNVPLANALAHQASAHGLSIEGVGQGQASEPRPAQAMPPQLDSQPRRGRPLGSKNRFGSKKPGPTVGTQAAEGKKRGPKLGSKNRPDAKRTIPLGGKRPSHWAKSGVKPGSHHKIGQGKAIPLGGKRPAHWAKAGVKVGTKRPAGAKKPGPKKGFTKKPKLEEADKSKSKLDPSASDQPPQLSFQEPSDGSPRPSARGLIEAAGELMNFAGPDWSATAFKKWYGNDAPSSSGKHSERKRPMLKTIVEQISTGEKQRAQDQTSSLKTPAQRVSASRGPFLKELKCIRQQRAAQHKSVQQEATQSKPGYPAVSQPRKQLGSHSLASGEYVHPVVVTTSSRPPSGKKRGRPPGVRNSVESKKADRQPGFTRPAEGSKGGRKFGSVNPLGSKKTGIKVGTPRKAHWRRPGPAKGAKYRPPEEIKADPKTRWRKKTRYVAPGKPPPSSSSRERTGTETLPRRGLVKAAGELVDFPGPDWTATAFQEPSLEMIWHGNPLAHTSGYSKSQTPVAKKIVDHIVKTAKPFEDLPAQRTPAQRVSAHKGPFEKELPPMRKIQKPVAAQVQSTHEAASQEVQEHRPSADAEPSVQEHHVAQSHLAEESVPHKVPAQRVSAVKGPFQKELGVAEATHKDVDQDQSADAGVKDDTRPKRRPGRPVGFRPGPGAGKTGRKIGYKLPIGAAKAGRKPGTKPKPGSQKPGRKPGTPNAPGTKKTGPKKGYVRPSEWGKAGPKPKPPGAPKRPRPEHYAKPGPKLGSKFRPRVGYKRPADALKPGPKKGWKKARLDDASKAGHEVDHPSSPVSPAAGPTNSGDPPASPSAGASVTAIKRDAEADEPDSTAEEHASKLLLSRGLAKKVESFAELMGSAAPDVAAAAAEKASESTLPGLNLLQSGSQSVQTGPVQGSSSPGSIRASMLNQIASHIGQERKNPEPPLKIPPQPEPIQVETPPKPKFGRRPGFKLPAECKRPGCKAGVERPPGAKVPGRKKGFKPPEGSKKPGRPLGTVKQPHWKQGGIKLGFKRPKEWKPSGPRKGSKNRPDAGKPIEKGQKRPEHWGRAGPKKGWKKAKLEAAAKAEAAAAQSQQLPPSSQVPQDRPPGSPSAALKKRVYLALKKRGLIKGADELLDFAGPDWDASAFKPPSLEMIWYGNEGPQSSTPGPSRKPMFKKIVDQINKRPIQPNWGGPAMRIHPQKVSAERGAFTKELSRPSVPPKPARPGSNIPLPDLGQGVGSVAAQGGKKRGRPLGYKVPEGANKGGLPRKEKVVRGPAGRRFGQKPPDGSRKPGPKPGFTRPKEWKVGGPKKGTKKKPGSRIVLPEQPGGKRPAHWAKSGRKLGSKNKVPRKKPTPRKRPKISTEEDPVGGQANRNPPGSPSAEASAPVAKRTFRIKTIMDIIQNHNEAGSSVLPLPGQSRHDGLIPEGLGGPVADQPIESMQGAVQSTAVSKKAGRPRGSKNKIGYKTPGPKKGSKQVKKVKPPGELPTRGKGRPKGVSPKAGSKPPGPKKGSKNKPGGRVVGFKKGYKRPAEWGPSGRRAGWLKKLKPGDGAASPSSAAPEEGSIPTAEASSAPVKRGFRNVLTIMDLIEKTKSTAAIPEPSLNSAQDVPLAPQSPTPKLDFDLNERIKKKGRPAGSKRPSGWVKTGPKPGYKRLNTAKKAGPKVGTKHKPGSKTAIPLGGKRPSHWGKSGPKEGYKRPATAKKPGPKPGQIRPEGALKPGPKKGVPRGPRKEGWAKAGRKVGWKQPEGQKRGSKRRKKEPSESESSHPSGNVERPPSPSAGASAAGSKRVDGSSGFDVNRGAISSAPSSTVKRGFKKVLSAMEFIEKHKAELAAMPSTQASLETGQDHAAGSEESHAPSTIHMFDLNGEPPASPPATVKKKKGFPVGYKRPATWGKPGMKAGYKRPKTWAKSGPKKGSKNRPDAGKPIPKGGTRPAHWKKAGAKTGSKHKPKQPPAGVDPSRLDKRGFHNVLKIMDLIKAGNADVSSVANVPAASQSSPPRFAGPVLEQVVDALKDAGQPAVPPKKERKGIAKGYKYPPGSKKPGYNWPARGRPREPSNAEPSEPPLKKKKGPPKGYKYPVGSNKPGPRPPKNWPHQEISILDTSRDLATPSNPSRKRKGPPKGYKYPDGAPKPGPKPKPKPTAKEAPAVATSQDAVASPQDVEPSMPPKKKKGVPKGYKYPADAAKKPGPKAGSTYLLGFKTPIAKGEKRPGHWGKSGPKPGSHHRPGARKSIEKGGKRPEHWAPPGPQKGFKNKQKSAGSSDQPLQGPPPGPHDRPPGSPSAGASAMPAKRAFRSLVKILATIEKGQQEADSSVQALVAPAQAAASASGFDLNEMPETADPNVVEPKRGRGRPFGSKTKAGNRGRPFGSKNKAGHKAGGKAGTHRLAHWRKTGPKKGSKNRPDARKTIERGAKRPEHWGRPGPKAGSGPGSKHKRPEGEGVPAVGAKGAKRKKTDGPTPTPAGKAAKRKRPDGGSGPSEPPAEGSSAVVRRNPVTSATEDGFFDEEVGPELKQRWSLKSMARYIAKDV